MLSNHTSVLIFVVIEGAFILSAICMQMFFSSRASKVTLGRGLRSPARVAAHFGLCATCVMAWAMALTACIRSTNAKHQASTIAFEQSACVCLLIAEVSVTYYQQVFCCITG